MKRIVVESVVLAALVWSLAACERDAVSGERRSAALDKGHDGGMRSSQVSEIIDGGPREMAPAVPLQVTGGTGGVAGSGGTFGSGGTGGSGGSSTGGTGGTNTGGASGTGGLY
jgi:hypothetical protein